MKRITHARILPLMALLMAATLFTLPLNAASTYYLKIGDIKGESRDHGHEDEIDVLSWSWGMSCSPESTGGGGGAGKVNIQDLTCTKELDKSTPKLMEGCAAGNHFPTAVLTCRRSGGATGEPIEYLVITMTDVLVTSVSTGGSGGEDRLSENVTLNFQKVHVIYTEQTADGTAGEQVEFSWDIAANTGG